MSSGRVAFMVRLPEELHKELRLFCAENNEDKQDVVAEAVQQFLHGSGGSSWPMPDATVEETQRSAKLVRLLRAVAPDVRAFLVASLDAALRRVQ